MFSLRSLIWESYHSCISNSGYIRGCMGHAVHQTGIMKCADGVRYLPVQNSYDSLRSYCRARTLRSLPRYAVSSRDCLKDPNPVRAQLVRVTHTTVYATVVR